MRTTFLVLPFTLLFALGADAKPLPMWQGDYYFSDTAVKTEPGTQVALKASAPSATEPGKAEPAAGESPAAATDGISVPATEAEPDQSVDTGGSEPAGSAGEAASAASAFAGDWNVKTERGDRFRLVMKQDGKKVTGVVMFKKDKLQFTGRVEDSGAAKVVWQLADIIGTGDIELLEKGKTLKGQLILADGSDLDGGTWDGSRAGTVSLPLGEGVASTGDSAGSGFVSAIVTSAVSVRDGPSSKKTKVLETLARGTKVSVKCDGGWCALADDKGYVAKQYLKVGATSLGASAPAVKKVTTAPVKKTVQKQAKKQQPSQSDTSSGFSLGGFRLPIIIFGGH